jgi:hypothetical protein
MLHYLLVQGMVILCVITQLLALPPPAPALVDGSAFVQVDDAPQACQTAFLADDVLVFMPMNTRDTLIKVSVKDPEKDTHVFTTDEDF